MDMKMNAKNYKTQYRLVCGKNRRFVKMPTYNGEIKELWQEWTDDKEAYYVYSYGKIIDGEFKSRYLGLGAFPRYKRAKRHNNVLMGNMRDNEYYKIIVCKCDTREGAAAIERNLISFFGRKDIRTGDLYNLTDGGEAGVTGYIPTKETRAKISAANSGENHPMYGKTHSEEARKKISEANKGKTMSEETRRKIGEASKARTQSEEIKRKLSEAFKGEKNPNYGKTGDKHPRYKNRNHITDEVLFRYLQSCKSWTEEIPTEWGVSRGIIPRMFKNRYKTKSGKKVQKILGEKLGKRILNHANFIEYCKLHKYEFLQMANYYFGVSGEQLQRWAARTYKSAKTQTINGWEKCAKILERDRKLKAKKRAS